jgi:cytochrome c oxidase assembly protein subunit 15
VFAYDTFRENILENKSGVQFIHRMIAYVVFLLGLVVWSKSRTGVFDAAQQKAANYVMLFIIVQFLLGIFTILYSVPVILGVLHQTGAFFLFASVLFLLHRAR